jgi:cell division transport system permease protein
MKSFGEKYSKKRYRVAYSTSVFSITLVLFLLGLLLMMVFYAGRLSAFFRENIGVSLVISSEADATEIMQFKNDLNTYPFVKLTRYISKDAAAKKLQEELGEDFVNFIGYNPLPPTLELFLYESYTSPDSLLKIKQVLQRYEIVENVEYEHQLLDLIDKNILNISRWVLAFSLVLLFIAVLLIHNTIRLSIYSKRMLIKSMLLVGASQRFIRRPFIVAGIYQGLAGGIVSVVLLTGILYFSSVRFPELQLLKDILNIVFAGLAMIGFGVLITWLSTYLAVKKYLKIRSEDLY